MCHAALVGKEHLLACLANHGWSSLEEVCEVDVGTFVDG